MGELIHIEGLGDFQMSKIIIRRDPYPIEKTHKNENAMEGVSESFKEETIVIDANNIDPSRQVSILGKN